MSTEENAENVIKILYSDKINKINKENAIEKEDLRQKLLKLFPKKEDYIKKLFENEKNDNNNFPKEIVLDEFSYNNEFYYKDKQNRIWSKDADLVGIVKDGNYLFFNDIKYEEIDLAKILN